MVTEVKCRPLTATLNEARATGSDGEAYQVDCQLPILADAPELVAWVNRHGRRRFVLLARDTLGNCYLSGTPANGMRLSWGRQITARHSQNLVVRGLSQRPLARLASVDPEVLFPNREFDYTFDLSFS
ncbi:hypothetical protein [Salmonirosea aquatica]|uniref:Uncharacterized protein n=1 Tax=Salmonirosea aquatica TaxID=2654236 RepID=A0A7C9F8K9_9BACT|nr:hypothetical protein [Cytophagaceae bacterium SJW1-29]